MTICNYYDLYNIRYIKYVHEYEILKSTCLYHCHNNKLIRSIDFNIDKFLGTRV